MHHSCPRLRREERFLTSEGTTLVAGTSGGLPPQAWRVVALLWIVAFLNYLDRLAITTMRGSILESIPMTETQFGLLTSVFLWTYGLLSPIAGFAADRFGRSRVIIASLFVWSVVTWLTGHARSFEQLLAARVLMGFSEAFYIPAALALIADYHGGRTRSLATGFHMTGIFAGAGLGGLGGWLAERYAWGFAFSVFGLVGALYAVALIALLRDRPSATVETPTVAPHRVEFIAALRSLFSQGSFLLLLAYWGLLGLAGWALAGWLPTYLGEHFKLGQGMAGLSATGYLQAAAFGGVLIGGAWADRWSRTRPRARILVPCIGLCLAAPGVFLAAKTSLLGAAVAGLILYGLARSFADANMMPILCLVADPRYRATGYGVLNFFNNLVAGLTVYAGGVLRDAQIGLSVVFQAAAASLIVCAAILFFVRPVRDLTPHSASSTQ